MLCLSYENSDLGMLAGNTAILGRDVPYRGQPTTSLILLLPPLPMAGAGHFVWSLTQRDSAESAMKEDVSAQCPGR